MLFYLALRNLFLLRKRYTLMAVAVAAGFALITVLTGISYGALETIKDKAARYFSGDVIVTGHMGVSIAMQDSDKVIRSVYASGLPVETASKRTIYYGKETRLFFGGNYITLLRAIGVDFNVEKKELSKLPFIEGGIEEILGENGKNGIFISSTAARILGARTGDDLILYLVTKSGQYNTETMIVRGIFDETNIFGYAAYMRNVDMNRLLNEPENWATEVAVYTKKGVDVPKFAENLRTALSENHQVFPPILSRSQYSDTRSGNRGNKVETLGVMSVDAQLEQLKNVFDAFLFGTYFVLIIFLLIVMMGILNTYRVLVYERTREIGTMRAVGMQSYEVKRLFLTEAAALALTASVCGFLLGFVTLHIISLFNFGGITAAGMFTENGKLQYYISPRIVLLNLLFMVSAVVLAAWGPAKKAALMPPAQALRKD